MWCQGLYLSDHKALPEAVPAGALEPLELLQSPGCELVFVAAPGGSILAASAQGSSLQPVTKAAESRAALV